MPYVRCERCGLTSFSAAYWSSIDECGRCHAALPRLASSRRFRPPTDAVSQRPDGRSAGMQAVLAELRQRREATARAAGQGGEQRSGERLLGAVSHATRPTGPGDGAFDVRPAQS
jgi:hypothetical protein